ncbi:MAG: cyclic-di-AMP receptor [Oscillospiraceae bacterium]|nr:cyclic-di-AMP receptor [Oscillospiraceae bacterium]
MKLLIAIVNKDDSPGVLDQLAAQNLPVTRLSTTGGFLRAGNDTLLLGLEDERVPEVLALLRECCSVRRQLVDVQQAPFLSTLLHAPVEVTVGGATVFVLDVEQFHKI